MSKDYKSKSIRSYWRDEQLQIIERARALTDSKQDKEIVELFNDSFPNLKTPLQPNKLSKVKAGTAEFTGEQHHCFQVLLGEDYHYWERIDGEDDYLECEAAVKEINAACSSLVKFLDSDLIRENEYLFGYLVNSCATIMYAMNRATDHNVDLKVD